jgi:regulator of protease activity HflC (stomatin/prohibitin superfamily)
MVESDKGGGPSSSGGAPPQPAKEAQPPIGGLVVDPRDIKTNPSLTKFLRERISGAIVSGLTAIGILRPRTANGELGTRHWKGLFIFLGTILAVIVVWTSVHVVQPGNVAVPVTFGHSGEPLGPGVHITLPFTRTYSMSTRTQNYTMSSSSKDGPAGSVDSPVAVLGEDGGAATVNATLLYRVDRDKASDVYRNLGRNYSTSVVRPTARSCVRAEFAKYAVAEAASTASGQIEDNVAECVKEKLESAGLLLQAFQLRGVALSSAVASAVDAKVAAQQKLQQQAFEEATAQKQADIVRIQALATNDQARIAECGGRPGTTTVNGQTVQTIIPNPQNECTGTALTPAYLQFSYIQALNNLAKSPNGSTFVVPFDKNLTPLISLPSNSGSTSTP